MHITLLAVFTILHQVLCQVNNPVEDVLGLDPSVASRAAFYVAGAVFLLGGIVGKVGAFLTTIPDPVLGGIVLVSFGIVTSVGLSALSFVDLSSSRNMTIIGTSLLIGLMIPRYLEANPKAIDTGNSDLDRVVAVFLGTSMFIGGVLAFILDNTIPGTTEERGIKKWRAEAEFVIDVSEDDIELGELSKCNAHDDDDKDKSRDNADLSGVNDDVINNTQSEHTANDTTLPQVAVENNKTDLQNNKRNLPRKKLQRSVYDLPLITPYLMKIRCARYCPFLPSFSYTGLRVKCRKYKKEAADAGV